MRIGELARRAGVSPDTLRFYEARGLIAADRRPNGYRDYPTGELARLALIRQAKALGFSLAEIGVLLDQIGGELPPAEVAALLQPKLDEIDARIAAMTSLRQLLADRIDRPCPLAVGARPAGGPGQPGASISRAPAQSRRLSGAQSRG